MSLVWSCSLLLSFLFQAGPVSIFPDGLFTEKEKMKIEKNRDDLDERIEAYKDASERIHKTIRENLSAGKYAQASRQLETWISLLSGSIEDVEANTNPKKKKSKDLIKYEIQIRKAVDALRNFKIRAPAGELNGIEQSIKHAEAVRGKMVDILFQPEKLSKEGADK